MHFAWSQNPSHCRTYRTSQPRPNSFRKRPAGRFLAKTVACNALCLYNSRAVLPITRWQSVWEKERGLAVNHFLLEVPGSFCPEMVLSLSAGWGGRVIKTWTTFGARNAQSLKTRRDSHYKCDPTPHRTPPHHHPPPPPKKGGEKEEEKRKKTLDNLSIF